MGGPVGTAAARPAAPDLSACVHCGFCLPVCPTYLLVGDENDSPRGRLHLMRAADEGRLARAGAYTIHLDRCLGCLACETACPAGVPFGRLLERARESIPRRIPLRLLRRLALWLLTGPWAPAAYAALRVLRGTGAARSLAWLLPGRLGIGAGMVAATRPVPTLHERRRRPRPVSPSTAAGRDGGTYALLDGCVMAGLLGHVHSATRHVLRRRDWSERRASGQSCCGALHAHAGDLAAARRMARTNIAAFERAGADFVIVDSAGCGAALREYPVWLVAEQGWRARAAALASRVRDVSEMLGGEERSDGERSRTLLVGAVRGRRLPRVGYDAPCHLLHAQGIRHQPVSALRRTAAFEIAVLPSSESCCGGAGLYALARPETARRILAPKLAEIRSRELEWLATGNPGCIMFIGAALLDSGSRTRAVHPVELIDAAERRRDADGSREAGGVRQ